MGQQYNPRANVLHQSLNEPRVIKGVPKAFFWLNGTFGLAILVGLRVPYFIPFHFILHLYLKHICRDDKLKDKVLKRRFWQADYYDPGSRYKTKRNPRPFGFGRHTL